MKSMTGYGRASTPLGNATLTVQVSSVNRKTLDLTLSIPDAWEALEPEIAESVRKYATRGKIHVDCELTGGPGGSDFVWNDTAVAEILRRLAGLASEHRIQFSPTPELIWQIANSQRKDGTTTSSDQVKTVLFETLRTALAEFSAMRGREGSALLADLLNRISLLGGYLNAIIERAPSVPKNYREQLLQRLRQAGLELDLNDERVLKEISLFADRCDISEEITRLKSHLEQFTALLNGQSEIGRKAEFILQEIGREIHTIGSKANDLEISRNIIESKNELERIREQIANVE